jgi:hypothetical protein
VLAKVIKRSSSGIPRFLDEGAMAKNLHARLTCLERQSSRGPFAKSVREMTDEELLRCAGLPPDASDKAIRARAAKIELHLGKPAQKEGTP